MKQFLFLVLCLVGLSWVLPVFATGIGEIGAQLNAGGEKAGFDTKADSVTDPQIIVGGIIEDVLTLVGTIFVVLIVLSGYKYLTANGESSQVESAQRGIMHAVIGLAIVLSAYGITAFVTMRASNAVRKDRISAYQTNNSSFTGLGGQEVGSINWNTKVKGWLGIK